MPRLARIVAALAFLLTGPLVVDADATAVAEPRPTVISLEGGLDAPLGLMGIEVERTVSRFFEVSAGLGVGIRGEGFGVQVGAMPRLTIPLGRRRTVVAIGAGVSYGPYEARNSYQYLDWDQRPSWTGTVMWGNGEVALERRADDGVYWRAFVGGGRVISGTPTCAASFNVGCVPDVAQNGLWLPYGGAALGFAF